MGGLTIIIPVYNEKDSISETINYFKNRLKNSDCIEAIFVDDNSTDGTSSVLKKLADPRFKIITHKKNRGYGASIKSAIEVSRFEYIAIVDADGSYPFEKIFELYQIIIREKADMVVAARVGEIVEINFFRRIPKYILKKLAEYLTEEEIPDLNSGLRIVCKKLIKEAMRFLPNSFSFTSTLTLYSIMKKKKLIYSPINYYKRKGKSKINPFMDTLNFFQLILRTVMFFNPLKVFLPVSILFFLSSFLVLGVSFLMGKIMDITTIILFITGLHLLAIGLLADLIDKRLNK